MSVLGLDLGYMVKYNPFPPRVPSGLALGNSFRQGLYLTVYPSSRPNTDTVQRDTLYQSTKYITERYSAVL